MRAGSLFSGGGGLDLAVEALFPQVEWAWHAESDPSACVVLEAHWPGVPNLGDLRQVDWTGLEPVDLLVGGYPCQPWSVAGKRKGSDDDRDGWPWFRDAIRHLGPSLVLLENVRGHAVPAGAGRTVGDLSDLGYDTTWGTVRASDVGAAHGRDRWFAVAADANGSGGNEAFQHDGGSTPAGHGPGVPHQPDRHTFGAGPHRSLKLLPTAAAADSRGTRNATSGRSNPDSRHHDGWTLNDVAYADRWDEYGPAIARWEQTLGRPAPDPVDHKRRLSPRFVEFLMGWPDGWTDVGLSRAQRLKILGNGVVPQQAYAAYSGLLERQGVAA